MANRYGLNDEPGLARPLIHCEECTKYYALIWHNRKLCKECLRVELKYLKAK